MTEPVLAAQVMARLEWWLLPQEPGDPRRVVGTATIVDGEAILLTDAIVGPQGIPGEPADIIRREYGITDPGDLPSVEILDESDNGRGWYIDGQWHVYDHGSYHILQGSIQGPPGTTPILTMSAEQIEAPVEGPIGEIDVDPSGSSTEPHFHLKIPGIPGPEGPASAIELASDYDDDGTPAEAGDFLVKKTVGWGPGTPTLLVPRKYTIPHNNFIAHTGSEPRFLIATQNIDAQDTDWYPDVIGRVKWWKQNILSSVQMEVEVRIGVTGASTGEGEPLCGLAAYDPGIAILDTAVLAYILPQFSTTADPDRAVAPDAGVGACLAGELYTVYVFMHKVGGSGNYSVTNDPTAQLRINVEPIGS
jgi:hypothetical protein